jgi:hypothetical protein
MPTNAEHLDRHRYSPARRSPPNTCACSPPYALTIYWPSNRP